MGYLTARPTSNDLDSQQQHNPWGGDELLDDTALLLGGLGKRCTKCKRVTRNQFLKKGLCPDCREKPADMPDIFKPKYLNLYVLTGYVKASLGDLANNTYSEQELKWGKAWIAELIQRLAEMQKEIPTAGQFKKGHHMTLSWSLSGPLHKAVVASGFTDECQWLHQLRDVIGKVSRCCREFLKNPLKAKKRRQKLKSFCEELCKNLPCEERFRPGPVALVIEIPPEKRCRRTNYMADGQPGEAD